MTTATREARNIEATKAIYAAVPAGDLQTALDLMDPEVRITYYGVRRSRTRATTGASRRR